MGYRASSVPLRVEKARNGKETSNLIVSFPLQQIEQHFKETFKDIKKQFSVCSKLEAEGRSLEAKDIYRLLIVYIEGALDFYLHELSKYAFLKMFEGKWDKTTGYKLFKIDMQAVEIGLKNKESNYWLLEHVNDVFSFQTYEGSRKISMQLDLIGINFSNVFGKMSKVNKKASSKMLDDLFARRNQIVHQTDRKHSSAQKEDIDKNYVQDALNFIENFVEVIHMIAKTK